VGPKRTNKRVSNAVRPNPSNFPLFVLKPAFVYKRVAAISWVVFQLSCISLYTQGVFRGKVIDHTTKEPLEAAVVRNERTASNVLTDNQGSFVLKNVLPSDSVVVSLIGYTTEKLICNTVDRESNIELKKGSVDLKEVLITSRSSANLTTSRTLSLLDINLLPLHSAQDMLKLIPGLFIAQHQGGGKAEQIFLRGFDADHGTDVKVSVDGMPVNLVSHAHGQGYADLHFLIPETIAGYDFGKGPYYASQGDFCTAGYVSYHTLNALDKNMVELTSGQYATNRLLAMINLLGPKAKDKGQSAYLAGEALYSNGGPFLLPEHFQRYNLFGKWTSKLGNQSVLTVTCSALASTWRASGEIPDRAVAEGHITSRWGALDTTQGGYTTRTNVNIKLSTKMGSAYTWENQVYYTHYYFNLISNFTFFYYDSTNGDQFNQHEKRNLYGYSSTLSRRDNMGASVLTSVAGLGLRYDQTHPSWLANTVHGDSIIRFVQLGNISQANLSAYLEETLATGRWVFNGGLRLDHFGFRYANLLGSSLPGERKAILSPKLSAQYTLNSTVQLYAKIGKGFHSNDARVVIFNEARETLPAAYGLDLGINLKPLSRLYINAALWYLYLQQEFTYGADYGNVAVQPGDRTVRKGIDLAARYQFNSWLFANLNVNVADAKTVDSAAGHNYLPLAPSFTSTAGIFIKLRDGLHGGISYRYLHDRPANSTYSLKALGYFVTDLSVNYTKSSFSVGISVQNLFNVVWNESQFAYTSRLRKETFAQSVDQVSYTPGTPLCASLKFALFF
jgi:CarboxypepD_reg-like domain/TonB-dependent Receptor Plug Domain